MAFSTVGFFREQDPGGLSSVFGPSIHECMGADVSHDWREICQYVGSGTVVMDVMDVELDIISDDQHISGASSILTDGEWIWRKDFIYYLKRYKLVMPEKFVERIRSVGYVASSLSGERMAEVEAYVLMNIVNVHS